MENKEISAFYDDFSAAQEETGVNERLTSLYRRMKKLGLKSGSKVLELGCGVGAFTKVLAKTVKAGSIEAVDLSPRSIETARKNVQKTNIDFVTADVVEYQPKDSDYDFITLMDVIEHIPLEKHPALFKSISGYCSEKTQILINIPNPYYIDFLIRDECDDMQIIDQPVWFAEMVNNLEVNNLEIIFFEKYSIWNEEDYDFFIVRKKRAYTIKSLASSRKVVEKAVNKFKVETDRLRFK